MQYDLYRSRVREYLEEMIDISVTSYIASVSTVCITCVVKHKAASAIGILSLPLADTPLS